MVGGADGGGGMTVEMAHIIAEAINGLKWAVIVAAILIFAGMPTSNK